jgi:hypothetical protein
VHRVTGLDDRDDLLGVAVDESHFTAVAQRHDEDVVDVVLVLLGFRAVRHRDDDLPGRLHFLHAELRRLRGRLLHEPRHQVDLRRRELARLTPARHAGR